MRGLGVESESILFSSRRLLFYDELAIVVAVDPFEINDLFCD